jgi:hypothetical protein
MIEITDEMVEAAATALAQSVDLCGGPHFCTGKEPCACRKDARAILTAVAPLIAAEEREAIAEVVDACWGDMAAIVAAIRARGGDA